MELVLNSFYKCKTSTPILAVSASSHTFNFLSVFDIFLRNLIGGPVTAGVHLEKTFGHHEILESNILQNYMMEHYPHNICPTFFLFPLKLAVKTANGNQ